MSKSSSSFGVSERINHGAYGLGPIVEITATYTIIDFAKGGRKKFVTSMVQLARSDSPAPARRPPRKKKVAAPAES